MDRTYQAFKHPYVIATTAATSIPLSADDRSLVDVRLPFQHLGVFARGYDTSQVLQGLPVYAIAQLGVINAEFRPGDDPPDRDRVARIVDGFAGLRAHLPLGELGTDHVGYASFDLGVINSAAALRTFVAQVHDAVLAQAPQVRRVIVGLRHLWVFPFADTQLLTDALVVGDVGPDFIVLRLEFDENMLAGRTFGQAMTSMQSPSIRDWRISPSSFSLSSALLIGQDGCETLLPANLATQAVHFRQVIRLAEANRERMDEARTQVSIVSVVEYLAEWFAIGHSLGRIEYSLPLAPAEKVRIAIVDWSRTDNTQRDEKTKLSEQLTHEQRRDRTLAETVQGVLTELQEGSNFQAGAALSAGAGVPIGPVDLGVGLIGAIGGSTAESSSVRNVQAVTMQNIADAFHQASTAVRELRSTVVMQVDQTESSNVQTRTIANYNHGHALTILYYEVLRHFRVVTRVSSERRALLVPYDDFPVAFNDTKYILDHRQKLESVLLDARLAPLFDLLMPAYIAERKLDEDLARWTAMPKAPDPGDLVINRFEITFKTGDYGTDGHPFVDLKFKDGSSCNTLQIEPNDTGNARRFGHPNRDDFEENQVDSFSIRPEQKPTFKWKELRGFVVGLQGGSNLFDTKWKIAHIKLEGFSSQGDRVHLFDQELNVFISDDTTLPELLVIGPPPLAPKPPPPTLRNYLSAEDDAKLEILKRHFAANPHHYKRALWLAEDANDRYQRLLTLTYRGEPLWNWIENKPLEVLGNSVAFALSPAREAALPRLGIASVSGEDFIEQLLTLPTRGMFAEAKLGHCNANEVIEKTRFWDWQISPIPDDAPPITGADAGSRYQAPPSGATSTPFPQSLVNIVNPQALPDPTGLGAALKVLGTPDIFRDMSGTKETAALLGRLSDNATQLASQGLADAEKRRLLDEIRSSPELSPQQKTDLIGALLTGQVRQAQPEQQGGGGTPTPAPHPEPAPTPSSTPTPTPNTPKETPPAPPPAPKPKRPTGDVATKANGLGFTFLFRRAVVGTPAEGKATITISPAAISTGATPEGAYSGYIPGVTIGPPPKSSAKRYVDFPMVGSSISVMTPDASAPGTVTVDATYTVKMVDAYTPISVLLADEGIADRTAGTIHLSGPGDYMQPKSGNVVMFDVSPIVLTKTYEISSGKKTVEEYLTEGGVSYAVVEAKAVYKSANETTTGAKEMLMITYLTGGLAVKQTNEA